MPWSALQPAQGGPIAHPNPVDDAVEAVRRAGAAGACPRGVKVRVLAGSSSPGWALALDGPPLALTLPVDGLDGTVPRFWGPRFGAAYADLQRALAADYDAVPEVREVAMTRCTTFYGEPLLRQATVPANAAALTGAGLDDATDERCLQEQSEAHRVWTRTPSSLALNPYVGPGDPPGGSLDLPLRAAEHCRTTLGDRCVLANNSLRSPVPPGAYAELYEQMRRLGAPLEFQTAGPRRVGDLVAAVQFAVEAGAASVETERASATGAQAALEQLQPQRGLGPGRLSQSGVRRSRSARGGRRGSRRAGRRPRGTGPCGRPGCAASRTCTC